MYNVLSVWTNWQITIMKMTTVFTIVGDQAPGLVNPRQVLSHSALFPAPRQFIKYVNINVFYDQLWMYKCFHKFRALNILFNCWISLCKETLPHFSILVFGYWLALLTYGYLIISKQLLMLYLFFLSTHLFYVSLVFLLLSFYIFLFKQFSWFQLIQIIL